MVKLELQDALMQSINYICNLAFLSSEIKKIAITELTHFAQGIDHGAYSIASASLDPFTLAPEKINGTHIIKYDPYVLAVTPSSRRMILLLHAAMITTRNGIIFDRDDCEEYCLDSNVGAEISGVIDSVITALDIQESIRLNDLQRQPFIPNVINPILVD